MATVSNLTLFNAVPPTGGTETRSATTRDGVVISVGDRVTTDYDPACLGRIFIVKTITPFYWCESGFMILVHLEHEQRRELHGKGQRGLDTNWFKPHHETTTPAGS